MAGKDSEVKAKRLFRIRWLTIIPINIHNLQVAISTTATLFSMS
jgi:hypothetical protein